MSGMRFLVLFILGIAGISGMAQAQTYGDLDTRFRFSLSRSETDPMGLVTALTTTEDYPCEGYTLRTKVTHQRDTVTVSILGMLRPDPCYSVYGKAKGGAFLGNKVAGKYFLRFLYRGVSDLYRLTFKDERSILTAIATSYTEQHQVEESYDQK